MVKKFTKNTNMKNGMISAITRPLLSIALMMLLSAPLLAAKPGQEQVAPQSADSSVQQKLQALQQQLEVMQKQLANKQEDMDRLAKQMDSVSDKMTRVMVDSTVIRVGNMKIDLSDANKDNKRDLAIKTCTKCKKPKRFETKWGGIDLGVNSFLSDQMLGAPKGYDDLSLVQVPLMVDVHLFRSQINLFKAHLNFNYGICFEFNNYKFKSNNYLTPKMDSVSFTESGDDLKKNKLSATYAELPMMLEFVSNPCNPDHSFHLGVGGSIGYLLNAHTKRVLSDGGKIKEHDDFNLNTLRYGLTGTIGFGKVTFFVNYGISTFFRDGVAPLMNPVSAGLVLIGFDD